MNALPALAALEAVLALPAADFEIAKDFARAEKAPATRRAYRSDFELFSAWCAPRRVAAIPASPETVAAFLAAEAARGIKPSSIGRRVAAIRYAHKLAGHDNPPTSSEIVKATARGIRRSIGAAKVRKAPILAETARAMAHAAPKTIKGLRDRARCCSALPAPSAAPSLSRSTSRTSRKQKMASALRSGAARLTRRARAQRSRSFADQRRAQ